ncbi:AraC family transcriptional regulator [Coprobacillaceae bacterium CR2/5/TPMF4]|nr:AraC family transcriptional regulator [Coprobacillaceae bacterium CR2/5/TPMF4]
MFLRIVTIYNHETITHQLEIRIYLLIIFKYFIDHQLLITNDYSKHNLEAIEIVLKYIEEHYDEKITSQMLAKLLNYNHQYFSRFFKDNTGYTPIEYINKYRIDMACEELLDEKNQF